MRPELPSPDPHCLHIDQSGPMAVPYAPTRWRVWCHSCRAPIAEYDGERVVPATSTQHGACYHDFRFKRHTTAEDWDEYRCTRCRATWLWNRVEKVWRRNKRRAKDRPVEDVL